MPARSRATREFGQQQLAERSERLRRQADEDQADGDEDLDEDQPDDFDADDDQADDDHRREPGRVAVAGAGIVQNGSGIILALVAYPLVVNVLRGGPAQMWGWVRAKFLNEPFGGKTGAQANAPAPPKQRPPSQIPPPGNRTAPTPTTTRSKP